MSREIKLERGGKNILVTRLNYIYYLLIIMSFLLSPHDVIANNSLFNDYNGIIMLDPGHGGNDHGVSGPKGTLEKNIALELANLIAAELKKNYKVEFTRTDDYNVQLDQRVAAANHVKADIFISLHTGGSFQHTPKDIIIYHFIKPLAVPDPVQLNLTNNEYDSLKSWQHIQIKHIKKSKTFSKIIINRLNAVPDLPQAHIKGAPLKILQSADMPAILIETGYLTNPKIESSLKDTDTLSKIAKAISLAINDFF